MNFVVIISTPYAVSEQERSFATNQYYTYCQTATIGFTRLSEPQVMVLTQRWKQRLCAAIPAMLPQLPIRPQRVRRWVLAAAVLLGWQPASALELLALSASISSSKLSVKQLSTVIVRGIILDKNNHQPIPGASILLKDTAFGVSAGYDGTFEFTIPMSQLKGESLRLTIIFIGYDKYQLKLKIEEPRHIYDLRIFLKPTIFSDF